MDDITHLHLTKETPVWDITPPSARVAIMLAAADVARPILKEMTKLDEKQKMEFVKENSCWLLEGIARFVLFALMEQKVIPAFAVDASKVKPEDVIKAMKDSADFQKAMEAFANNPTNLDKED